MNHIVSGVKGYLQSWYYPTWAYGKVRGWAQPMLSTAPNVDQITDRIYLGGISTAFNGEHLKELGVTHVVGCVLGLDPYFDDFVYKMFPVRDIPSENMIQYFDEANAYMTQVLNENETNKIYLHCICGVSRSATLLGAYLMNKMNWDAKTAILFIQSKRDVVNPNPGFRKQLQNYQETLNPTSDADDEKVEPDNSSGPSGPSGDDSVVRDGSSAESSSVELDVIEE